jgi:hypothetical protein
LCSKQPRLTCAFYSKGFPISDGPTARPCYTQYHPQCLKIGKPFETRLKDNDGLSFPKIIDLPHFVCEVCTVREVVGRELRSDPNDTALVMLERARLIDTAHHWAASTHKQYQSKLRMVRKFEGAFGVSILRPTPLTKPPNSPDVPAMWLQQQYSLRPGGFRAGEQNESAVSWSTVRGLRSAISQFYSWDLTIAQPTTTMQDSMKRPVMVNGCLPTDSLGYSYMSSGMSRRLGDNVRPSTALLARHIMWIDKHFEYLYRSATTQKRRRLLCRAALVNVAAWLGWLRAAEAFGLEWIDMEVTEPHLGPTVGLPANIGVARLRLQLQTKTERTRQADVILAYTSSSGLSFGKWYHRLGRALGGIPVGHESVFRHDDGTVWTSHYYRTVHLLPLLHLQQLEGDPFLAAFDGSPGNSLEAKFYSMNSYRRGGRSQVSRKREHCIRKAEPQEVTEHGRWRRQSAGFDMPTQYLEWTLLDRIALTLFCM